METQQEDRPIESNRWFIAHLAVSLLVLLVVFLRLNPPAAKSPDAAEDVFSVGRVRNTLERIIRPGVSHATGSADHARMRDAVIEEFRRLGFEPEIQGTFSCNGHGDAEQVQNILVHMSGTDGSDAIALVAHYDSVPAGPGVADDASGVCSILEIARILANGPPPRNDVLFLITDAEELGLHGARAFTAEHPLIDKIRVVLNWEARGTRGPSFMFQTGPNNLGLIRLMARHCRRSISTSLFPAIYERLPNDTDLTIFIDRDIAGLNFAFIGGLPHYHTRLDNLKNLDLRSVQHQGEHFFAMVQALSNAHLDELPKGNAVFFDVLGWFTVCWPQQWNLAFAIVVAMIVLAVTRRHVKETSKSVLLAQGVWLLTLIIAALLGEAACRLVIACTGESVPGWAWPQPMCVALWSLGISLPIGLWWWLGRHMPGEVSSAATLLCWLLIGVLLVKYLPGGSYLFTVPVAVACLFRLVAFWRHVPWELANLVFLVVVCLLWFPVTRGLVDALGVAPSAGQTVPLALIGLIIAPTIRQGVAVPRFLLAASTLIVAALVVAMIVPPYSEKWPQPVSIVYSETEDEAFLDIQAQRGEIPDGMCHDASSDQDSQHYATLKVDPAGLDPPHLEVQTDETVEDGRHVRLLVKPGEGQHRVVLFAEPEFGSTVTANGRPINTPVRSIAFNFSEQKEAEIEFATTEDVRLKIIGIRYDLPETAEAIRNARPPWTVPISSGDFTRVLRIWPEKPK